MPEKERQETKRDHKNAANRVSSTANTKSGLGATIMAKFTG
jgi:hypothetical protein